RKIRWIKGCEEARPHSPIEYRITYCGGRTEICVAFSRLTEIGEQAVAAVAASLARGGPVIKGQLIASRFYEAMQHELKRLHTHDPKRAALIAASDRCQRIAAARINPSALLDDRKKPMAVCGSNPNAPAPPTRARPVLRLIEGGLSKNYRDFFFFGSLPRALPDGACLFAPPPRPASTLRRNASI